MNFLKLAPPYLLRAGILLSEKFQSADEAIPHIYHVHIRKTGGSSINGAFLSLSGVETPYRKLVQHPVHRLHADKIYVGWDKPLIERSRYFYAFSHIPLWSLNLPANTFIFTCFRDPVKRLMSHYNMLKDLEQRDRPHASFEREKHWLGRSFDDFLDRIPKEHLLNQLYTFSASFTEQEALQCARRCKQFLRTESLAEGLNQLGGVLDLHLEALHVRKSGTDTQLTNSELARLVELLKPEYDFLEKLIGPVYKLPAG